MIGLKSNKMQAILSKKVIENGVAVAADKSGYNIDDQV